jgi:hypothetical protein
LWVREGSAPHDGARFSARLAADMLRLWPIKVNRASTIADEIVGGPSFLNG